MPFTVHSAHVGDDLEVHYQWHPYFGRKVNVRRVDQRATGQSLRVRGPSGTVIVIAGWMVDPIVCARMISGPPQVNLTALSELKRLVTASAASANSPSDGIAWEDAGETGTRCRSLRPATESGIRARQAERDERGGAGEGVIDARPNPHAGRRPGSRGVR